MIPDKVRNCKLQSTGIKSISPFAKYLVFTFRKHSLSGLNGLNIGRIYMELMSSFRFHSMKKERKKTEDK